jgi:hypothetical protein
MNLRPIVEGDTARITFQLYDAPGVALDGTGLTLLDLVITGNDGTAVDTVGDFGWANQAGGQIYYDPDSTDFVASKSPYRVRAQLRDGTLKTRHYPQGAASLMMVRTARQ